MVENDAHAEVRRTSVCRDDWAVRREEQDDVDTRDWRGRLDAIEAIKGNIVAERGVGRPWVMELALVGMVQSKVWMAWDMPLNRFGSCC